MDNEGLREPTEGTSKIEVEAVTRATVLTLSMWQVRPTPPTELRHIVLSFLVKYSHGNGNVVRCRGFRLPSTSWSDYWGHDTNLALSPGSTATIVPGNIVQASKMLRLEYVLVALEGNTLGLGHHGDTIKLQHWLKGLDMSKVSSYGNGLDAVKSISIRCRSGHLRGDDAKHMMHDDLDMVEQCRNLTVVEVICPFNCFLDRNTPLNPGWPARCLQQLYSDYPLDRLHKMSKLKELRLMVCGPNNIELTLLQALASYIRQALEKESIANAPVVKVVGITFPGGVRTERVLQL